MTDHAPHTGRKRLGLVTLAFAAAALVAAAAPRAVLAQDDDQDTRTYASPTTPAPSDDQSADADDGVPATDALQQRMSDVQARIDDALDNGAITQFQANRDLDELANIRTQSNELKERDGELTLTDRQFINSRLDRLDGRITYAENSPRRW